MLEDDMAQLYVSSHDDSKLQVSTVSELNDITLGFVANVDGKYTLEFSRAGQLKGADIYLHDAITGTTQRVGEGLSYSFEAKKGETASRFSLTSTNKGEFLSADEVLIKVSVTEDGNIVIVNGSSKACSTFFSDSNGAFLQRVEVEAHGKAVIESFAKGTYMVRLQNSEVSDVRRVTIE